MQYIDRQACQTVSILLIESDLQVREGLRAALSQEGFCDLLTLSSLESVKDGFETMDVDLLVVDVGAKGADACTLIRQLRHSRKGRNPFVSVILTVQEEDTVEIEKLLNSGADHILVKPISPKALFARIAALIDRRRLFVATSFYIGPDRRSGERSEESASEIPLFAVPNTLKLKAEKQKISPEELQKAINVMLGRISVEMLDKLAFQIVFQQHRVKEALKARSENLSSIKDLRAALDSFIRYVDPAVHLGVVELVAKLNNKLSDIEYAQQEVSSRDIELIEKLSLAIYMAFKGDEGTDALASKISGALETFAKKTAKKKTSVGGLQSIS